MVKSLSGLELDKSKLTVGSAYEADDIDWHGRLGLAQIASALSRPIEDTLKGRYKRDLKNPDEGKKKKAEEGLQKVRARSKAAQSTVKSLAESIIKRKKSGRETETGPGRSGIGEQGGAGGSTAVTQTGSGKEGEEDGPPPPPGMKWQTKKVWRKREKKPDLEEVTLQFVRDEIASVL
jgi:hypothetical protein